MRYLIEIQEDEFVLKKEIYWWIISLGWIEIARTTKYHEIAILLTELLKKDAFKK